jgi:hypothetical protein
VGPGSKWLPDPGGQLTGGEPATASVAEPDPYATFVPVGSPVGTVTSAGGVTTGAVVSTTVTVSVVEAGSSHVTGVSPIGNVEPEAGVQVKPPSS